MAMLLFFAELFAFALLLIILFADLAGERRLFQNGRLNREKKIQANDDEKIRLQDQTSDKK